MKMPKLFLRKILLGIVLIALATGITVIIKETLDTRDPESSLPMLSILYNEAALPSTSLYRAGYEWSFFTTIEKHTPSVTQDDLPLTPYEVSPGVAMQFEFTKEPSELFVWRADGRYSTDYVALTSSDLSTIYTPMVPGVYVYRVRANWATRGYIQYYFCVSVRNE